MLPHVALLAAAVAAVAPLPAHAAQHQFTYVRPDIPKAIRNNLDIANVNPGAPSDPEIVIGTLIRALLSILGVLFLLLIIYGGFLWMTAQGSEEKIDKAKRIILSASLGLSVVLAAYLITVVVIQLLAGTTIT